SDRLNPGTKDKLYHFSGTQGQRLYFNSISSDTNLDWILYGEDNQVIWQSGWRDVETVLPNDGLYILALRGKAAFGDNVPYTFQIVDAQTVNGILSFGNNTIPNTVNGNIVKKGEQDVYTFTGTAGQRIDFDVLKDGGSYTNTATLYSPSGIKYLDNYYLNYGDVFPFTLNENGAYKLVIDAIGGNTGAYSFSMLDVAQATPINLDTDITGTLAPGSSTQLYQFNGIVGQHLYMNSLLGAAGNWYIYDSSNNRVAANGLSNDFELTLSKTDTYTLVIQGGGSQGTDSNTPINYKFRIIDSNTPTTPISFGTNATPNFVSDSIVKKGDINTYTFTGTAGQRIDFDVLKDGGYYTDTATLYSPSGIKYLDNYYLNYGDVFPFTLNENGTYQLVIDAIGGNTGAYSFSLLNVAQATPINLDTDINGTLTPGSSTQLYQFNGTTGQHLYMNSLLGAAGSWYIYDSGNNRVAATALANDFELTLSKTDTYTLLVQGGGSQGTDSNTPINYKFRIINSNTPTTTLSFGTNTTPNVVNDSIVKKGDVNTYTFTGTAGQRLDFDVLKDGGYYTDTATLYSPSGITYFNRNLTDGDAFPFTLNENGTYKLVIDAVGGNTNAYSFSMLDVGQATAISLDSDVTGALNPGSSTQLYQFNGSAGQHLYINSLLAASGNLYIYDSANNRVTASPLSNDFELTLSRTDTYTLLVQGAGSQGTDTNASINYNFHIFADNTPTTPLSLGSNTTPNVVSDSIVKKGDFNTYTFTGTAGQRLYFDVLKDDGYYTDIATLYSPNGITYFNRYLTDQDALPFTLNENGTYKLVLDTTGGNTGAYSFSMLDVGQATAISLDSDVTGTLTPGLSTQLYQFNGSAGQHLYINSLLAASGNLYIYDSANNRVTTSPLSNDFELTLSRTDTYTLLVQGTGSQGTDTNASINYNFHIFADNTPTTPLSLGSNTTPNVVSDSIVKKGDFNTYTFTGTAGEQLYFDTISSVPNTTEASLYSPSGFKLFDRQLSDGDYGTFTLVESGNYKLVIDGVNASTDPYSFRIADGNAATSLTLSTAFTSSLPANQVQLYRIDGSAGQRLQFNNLTSVSNADWVLYGPAGNVFASASLNNVGVSFETALPTNGAYVLAVRNFASSAVNFNVQVNDISTAFVNNQGFGTIYTGTSTTSSKQTLTANAGTLVYFDAQVTNNYYGGIPTQLLDPTGTQVFYINSTYDNGIFILPTTSNYTLQNAGNGSYSYQLLDLGTATNLTLNTNTTVNLSAYQTTAYKFSGAIGQQLFYDGLTANSGVSWKLISPSGQTVVDWNDAGGDWGTVPGKLTFQEVGTYYLLFSNGSAGATSASFRILDRAGATPYTFDDTVSGSFTGKESYSYRFSGTQGQYIYIDQQAGSYTYYGNNYWNLYGPEGQYITSSEIYNDKEVVLPATGDYFLIESGNGSYDPNYKFRISVPSLPMTAYTLGATVNGTISKPGENNTYTFTGTFGQQLFFDALNTNDPGFTVRLISPSGTDVRDSRLYQDIGPDSGYTLKESGTYKLVIDGDGGNTGDYSFRLLDKAGATPYTQNTLVNGTFTGVESYAYRFSATQGQLLYLYQLEDQNYNWTLYGPEGQPITTLNPYFYYNDRELVLPFTGDYLLVESGSGSSNHNYKFHISLPTFTTTAYTVGSTVNGTISQSGENDTYTFTGTFGQQLFFDGLNSNDPGFTARLISPSGIELKNGRLYQDFGPDSGYTLKESGTYKLIIDGDRANTGDYSFRLLDKADATPYTLDTTVSVTFSGRESYAYRFSGTQGQYLYIDQIENSYYNWGLYGPGGQYITGPGIYYYARDQELALPSTGDYLFVESSNGPGDPNFLFRISAPSLPSTAYTLGSTVNGTINKPGENDTYTFTGTFGQQLFFDGLNSNDPGFTARLISPSGIELKNGRLYQDFGPDSGYTLKESGNYKLVIDGDGANTGDYSFRLLDKADATPYTLDTTVSGTFTGRESYTYRFSGTQGQYIYIDQQAGDYNNYWNLYGPGGQYITSNYIYADQELALPSTGDYFLVESANNSGNPNYKFRIATPSLPTTTYTLGSTVNGTISKPGENDTYTFTGTFGQQLFFDGLNYNDPGFTVQLISPSGIDVKDGRLYQDFGPDSGYTLKESGTYKLVIDGDGANTGDYSFRLLDKADATPYTLDTTISGIFTGRESYTYRFSGTQGQYIYIDQQAGDYNNYWNLYGPGGQYITSNYIYADQELALPSTGDYFLVESANNSGNPNYKFRIAAPNLRTTAYTLGSTVSSNLIEKGEFDTYTFTARSGQRLYWDRLTGIGQITAKLYSPSGVIVADGNLANDISPFFLRESGNYRLVIDGSGETTGNYSFRLVDIDTAPTLTLDTSVSAILDPGTETDFYQFTGTSGERLYFHLGATNWPYGLADWVLYGADNQAIAAPNYFSPDFSIILPTAGTYVLGVRGYGATSLGYSFTAYTDPISTTSLALGTTVTSTLSKPGERDDYTFTGTVGQHLFLDALVGSSSIHAKLIAPNGVQLFDNTLDRDGIPIILTDSGTYRLAIDGDRATTGNYSFRFSDMAAATALSVGTTTNGSLMGNSVNFYSYSGKAGQTLNFNLGSTTWNGANWVLYDASGAVLAAPNASSPNFQVTLAANSVYTLAIVGSSSNPVNYSFTVTDNSAAATTNSGFGTLQTLFVNANQVVDYNFTASAGTILLYDSTDEQNRNSGNYYLGVRLLNPDGTYAFNGQDPRYDTAPTVLTQSGNYKLQVYNGYNAPTTIAAFQLLQLPKTLGPGTNYLQMDSPVTGILNHAESKVYTFQGVNGLKILLNGMAGATNYTLYDSSGRQVFTQYNPGGYYWQPPVWADSSLYTLTQNDLYHLVVSNISGADNNPYSFEVLETANVQSVNYGIPIADSLTDGRLDSIYKIKANLGDNLFFDSITTNAPNGNYRWKLYDPGNQLLFNNDLRTDASVTISETGDYYLEVEGGPDTNQINYQFRVFSYTPTANTIITPGAGGTSSSDPNALGVFSVQLGVKDGKGGTDVQNYKIRVGADPEDHNPVISSNPETRFALTDDAYRYSVKAIDADGDKLSYRLVNSPIGALINKDTGELLWFPDSNVAVGGKANFTVEVSDERGGKDSQSFSVDIYQSLGTIQGAVFNDLNANGLLDSKLITGDNPSIVFAIDVSGSTIAPFHGNGKYKDVKTVLDAEKAAIQATIDAIIAMGGGDKVKISFIPFTNDGTIQDMNPAAHTGLVTYTTAFADLDNNSIPDYLQILNSYTSGGSSKFTQVAQKIDTLINVLPGTPNVIYMSDGYGYLDPTVAKTLANDVKSKGGNLNAFAIGSASTYSTLQELDPYAIQVVDINELTDIFSGFDDRYAKEPFMNGVTVYLDQNNNGQLDPGESYQITQQDKIPNSLDINSKYYFSFKNLLPGTYTVRTLLPSGYTMTSPTTNVWTDTITAAGETNNNLFGITQATIVPPNQNPVFVTTPPAITLLKADQQLRYNAFARDPDANIVTYDLITAPEGMAVDAHDGMVVWSPTSTQVEKYYQDLYAEQARLTAIGRGAYAPTDVEFNVLLRATDGQGGQALQYLKVQLVPNNHPPVFTSTSPNNLQPQVGKPFQYQTTATDPDNDSVTFSLVNPPSGAVINANTGLLTWTPTANQLGNQQFSIQVQDSFGNSNLQSVNLTVVNAHVNHSPVFTSTPRTSTRTQNPYIYNLQATDPDNDPLTFSLVNAPAGMTLNQGVLVWQPTASQFGNNSVSVQVSDGQGGTTTQNWTIQVSNQLSNLPPTITSTPSTVTSLGRTYIYKPTAIDSDGDRLTWSLVSDTVPPPQGMVIDEQTGTIVWQPTANQIGDTTVSVQATDIYGAYNVQEFTIHVNGINSPPKFVSTPITTAGVGQGYSYQALATDPENDALIFTLGSKPSGMTITKDGLIQWTPTANQVGKYDIQVIATDNQGASTNQTYTLIAGTTPVNHPPVISSTPVFLAAVGHTYNYQVAATDADNNPITYQLLSAPDGMTIDANTGLLTWATPVAGSYQVVVGADDGTDGAAQGFTLTAKTITPPIIQSTTPPNNAIPNTLYRYDIIAFDSQGDRLTYSIDAASQNLGMILDSQGRLSWIPTTAQVGDHAVTLTVTDSAGFNTLQTFNLNVTPDTVAPKVKLIASY
ncbi:putative Ig domain-containing protein, partial [Nostoc sp.]|uniref:putative Ig domain-containing protein n=1 Tax=Nostoc sp. TaxID=1180 RepID=UPI002FF470EE